MPPISKPEVRFKEGSGERFLKDGKTIRCHAQAKSKIRKWREEFQDEDTPTDYLWPECQCERPACEGQYVCRYHGGKTPRTANPPRTILDIMPMELAEKFKMVMEEPDYISRQEDIYLIKARVRMLVDELNNYANSEESWGYVSEALNKLKKGETVKAVDYLERALRDVQGSQETWNEIYKTEKLLGDMTTIQVKTAKDLQTMASVDQVQALMATVISLITSGAKVYIPDPMERSRFTTTLASEINNLMGLTPAKMINAANSD